MPQPEAFSVMALVVARPSARTSAPGRCEATARASSATFGIRGSETLITTALSKPRESFFWQREDRRARGVGDLEAVEEVRLAVEEGVEGYPVEQAVWDDGDLPRAAFSCG